MFYHLHLRFFRARRFLLISLFTCLSLAVVISAGCLSRRYLSENGKFEAFSEKVFRNEVSGSSLNLHYSLAYPEKQGISPPPASLGTVNTSMEKTYKLCEKYEKKLKSFAYSRLSHENQITLDMMLLYYHTVRSLDNNYLLQELLGPSLGIQAQLPVLLAEYAFYEKKDVTDYLKLLTTIRPYFESILDFEKARSQAGFFMSDTTLDRILEQCEAFIRDPDSNYMLDVFEKKLKDLGLSGKDIRKLCQAHKKLIINEVIPAYQELMDGLDTLRGTGRNDRGLYYFTGGREYYTYLLKSQVGTWIPVAQIEKRLSSQLTSDISTLQSLTRKNPQLLTAISGEPKFKEQSPKTTMTILQKKMEKDFPPLKKISWELRNVHDSMKDYLSPAFYLTPPLDTGSPNVIYINPASSGKGLSLFTTLAHEGFPGHLYQSVYFGRQKPSHIRYLLDTSGFAEGWATYTESFAYGYAADYIQEKNPRELAQLAWLNRSVNLCLYSLLDIEIHYRGWSPAQAASFLKAFGISDPAVVREIYQYIVETPANYLKYYWGYLSILDLRTSQQKRLGDKFDLKDFHRKVLKLGGVQFPVLEKYITQM